MINGVPPCMLLQSEEGKLVGGDLTSHKPHETSHLNWGPNIWEFLPHTQLNDQNEQIEGCFTFPLLKLRPIRMLIFTDPWFAQGPKRNVTILRRTGFKPSTV